MYRIISIFISMKTAIAFLFIITLFSILSLYVKVEALRLIIWQGLNLMLAVLGLSMLVCSSVRIVGLLKRNQARKIDTDGQKFFSRNSQVLLDDLIKKFSKLGFKIRSSGNGFTAVKFSWGLWGSLIFHLGIVLVLLGFFLNSILGFGGNMLLLEKALFSVPQDLYIYERARFFREPPPLDVGLVNFSLGSIENSYSPELLRPTGTLFFRNAQGEKEQQFQINQPAEFAGLTWRYKEAGYSLFVNIQFSDGTKVSDYINIGSQPDNISGDVVNVSESHQLEVRFYPDYIQKGGRDISESRLPKNPVLEMVLIEKGKAASPVLVPLGETITVGETSINFPGFRYWVALDVQSNPGKNLILFGGWIAVLGLAWRVVFITQSFACKVTAIESKQSIVQWGSHAVYGEHLYREKIVAILHELEE